MEKYSENPEKRITGRTIHSTALIGELKDKTILNIGCLGGWLEKRAMTKCDFKKMYSLDLPGTLVKNLQKTNTCPHLEYIEGNVLKLPFEDNTFDIVSIFEVLEHLPKGTELFAFKEINRVLKPDGFMILSTPYSDWRNNIFDPAWWLLGHRHYTVEHLLTFLAGSNFEKYHIEVRGGYFELFGMVWMYIFKHLFRKEYPFKKIIEEHRLVEFEKPGFTNLFLKAFK